MLVQTARFGELNVNETDVWILRSRIFGFESFERFISISQDNSPFEFFQSVEDEHLTFVLTDPFLFFQNYEFSLEKQWLELLHLDSEKEVTIRCIVTVRSPVDISINLKAPIVMNLRTKEAAQIILNSPDYGTRHLIVGKLEGENSHADSIEK